MNITESEINTKLENIKNEYLKFTNKNYIDIGIDDFLKIRNHAINELQQNINDREQPKQYESSFVKKESIPINIKNEITKPNTNIKTNITQEMSSNTKKNALDFLKSLGDD